MQYIYGIDVGGTTVKIGIFTKAGELKDKWEIDTNISNNGSQILLDIAKAIKTYNKSNGILDSMILGYGFGVPGPVKKGIALRCPNLGWGETDVPSIFSDLIKHENVKCGNDANVAAAGEFWFRKHQGISNLVLFTLGTGVGGGLVINNQVIDGSHGGGGELGHIIVETNHPKNCSCGLKGCLETVASARGIVEVAKDFLSVDNNSILSKHAHLSAKNIFDAAKNQDVLAMKVVDKVSEYLGQAAASIAVTVDPEVFIIGGGVSNAGNILVEHVTKHYKKYAHFSVKDTHFELAVLGNDAGMLGAAYLVLL